MGGEPDDVRTRSNTPSFCRISIPLNWNICVDSVSLGNSAWSTTQTDSPARRRNVASGERAQRAPGITTSKRSFVPLLGIGSPYEATALTLAVAATGGQSTGGTPSNVAMLFIRLPTDATITNSTTPVPGTARVAMRQRR